MRGAYEGVVIQDVAAWSELIWSAIGRLNTETEATGDFDGQVHFETSGD
jgi:hypothetical protein